MIRFGFIIFEFIGFILPALPDNLNYRLLILLIYFISHVFKIQYQYLKIKNKYTK